MIQIIEAAWNNRELLNEKDTVDAIEEVIEDLDKGKLRVAEPTDNGLLYKLNGSANDSAVSGAYLNAFKPKLSEPDNILLVVSSVYWDSIKSIKDNIFVLNFGSSKLCARLFLRVFNSLIEGNNGLVNDTGNGKFAHVIKIFILNSSFAS